LIATVAPSKRGGAQTGTTEAAEAEKPAEG
jgi:hypothetical protein